jgi:glycosyltransferase involved in cell wall biosynthesis
MSMLGKRAVVICGMLGHRGGGCLAPLLLCQELARLGLRVTCFTQLGEFLDGHIPKDFKIVTPWMQKGCRWDMPGKCLAWQARRWIRRERPAFVFVAGVVSLARYLLKNTVADQLLLWEFTNANPGNKFVDAKASRLLGRARAVLSPSAAIDQGIRQTYHYRGRLLRLPFWIKDTELKPSAAPVDFAAEFIFLGRRDAEKGLKELIAATGIVARRCPGIRVLITGSGSEQPFAAQAAGLGLTANIRFQYFSSYAEIMGALANSRCLVLPSYHEGYPLVLLEAAQLGVPFIATQVGSVAEVFDGTGAGLIVPPRDEKALAAAMLTILEETPGSYRQRRASAYEVFRRVSSKAAVEASLRRVLEELKQ